MDAIYILMICAGVLFFILLFSYFIYAYCTKRRNMRKEQALRRVYADKNLAKMEYSTRAREGMFRQRFSLPKTRIKNR